MNICLKEFGVVCAIGQNKQQVFENLISNDCDLLVLDHDLPLDEAQYVGKVALPEIAALSSISTRNNKLAYLAYQQIAATLEPLIAEYGNHRLGVVIGTSTAGIYEGEQARKELLEKGRYPADFHYKNQEMADPANYIARLCHATGPVYGVSTACSSSGKALASAKALITGGLADVVVVGGVDSLAQLTVNGFKSLESISKSKCTPFSSNRDGINIGEAAALFVMCKGSDGIQLLGTGESSDAFHMSAPAPDGEGAYQAMQNALDSADLKGEQIDYVNLHGTGTIKNDDMEAKAMAKACSSKVLCGSTKRLTGHTLGASGALEIGFCWLLLSDLNITNYVPKNVSDGDIDSTLSRINLSNGQSVESLNFCMSNSFAFGGNNFSAVLGKGNG